MHRLLRPCHLGVTFCLCVVCGGAPLTILAAPRRDDSSLRRSDNKKRRTPRKKVVKKPREVPTSFEHDYSVTVDAGYQYFPTQPSGDSPNYDLGIQGDFILEGSKSIDDSLRYKVEFISQRNVVGISPGALIDPGEIYVGYAEGKMNLQVGFQRVAWGEAFAFSATDIVNPPDYSNPLTIKAANQILPSPLVNAVFSVGESLSIQALVAPCQRDSSTPPSLSRFDPIPRELRSSARLVNENRYLIYCGSNAFEYGGRISYLFPNGLDTSVLAYRHQNRGLLYEVVGKRRQGEKADLQPVRENVFSAGGTSSYSLDAVVFRSELLYTLRDPAWFDFDLGLMRRDTLKGAFSFDWTPSSQLTMGAQVNVDRYSSGPTLAWVAGFAKSSFLRDRIEAELISIMGLGNRDKRIRVLGKYQATPWAAFLAAYDFVDGELKEGPPSGRMGVIRDMDNLTFLLNLSHAGSF